MVGMYVCEKILVYTLYIQSAENRQKNESLSKNKCSNFVQEFVANDNLSFNLTDVSKTIDNKSITKQKRGDTKHCWVGILLAGQ
jgi:hypothetical protein